MAIYDGPVPSGYTPWGKSPLTPAMVSWAQQINKQTGMSHYGEIFHTVIDGVPVAGRIEHHAFTYDSKGNQIPCPGDGCHGVTLYHPPPEVVPATQQQPTAAVPDNSTRTASLILLATALFGTALTVASAYFKSKTPRASARDEEE